MHCCETGFAFPQNYWFIFPLFFLLPGKKSREKNMVLDLIFFQNADRDPQLWFKPNLYACLRDLAA